MQRQTFRMDAGWRFHLGDLPVPPARGHDVTYNLTKAERARGAMTRDYDDSAWPLGDLPHDYVVRGQAVPEENEDHACLPRPNAYYRRTFLLEEADQDSRIVLHFDGVVTRATVAVNGLILARSFTGAVGFDADITDVARFGQDANVVAVYVDNTNFEGWYYEGGGINRHVWLIKTSRQAVDTDGVFVHTSPADAGNLAGDWVAEVQTTLRNDYREATSLRVRAAFLDPQGREAAEVMSEPVDVLPYGKATAVQRATLPCGQLWSVETPTLYTLRTQVLRDGDVVDEVTTPFGLRTLEYDAERGLLLNGVPTFLRGMSNHLDYAGLGVAVPDNVIEYRIQRLKDMGCNAYRCAHNPCPPHFYEACDRMGMLVMDETRWFDSSQEGLSEMEAMIRAHRNHPSVILWSLNNEEPAIGQPLGWRMMARMAAHAHALDPTRPVTGAMLHNITHPHAGADFDVLGVNYNEGEYDAMRRVYPDKAIFGSETGCGYNPSGIKAWRVIDTHPYFFGTFPWTGWSYRGEARWPRIFAGSGCIDICGQPRDSYYYYQALWLSRPVCRLGGHWNPAGPALRTVTVFTNGEEAELTLNGRSLGRKAVDPYEMVSWEVPYEPGALQAEAFRDGASWAVDVLQTSGKPTQLALVVENPGLAANGQDVALVTAYALDARGARVPDCQGIPVTFDVAGGMLVATSSNDRADTVPVGSPVRALFGGSAQAMVRMPDTVTPVTVTATCTALGAATLTLTPRGCTSPAQIPLDDCRFVPLWRMGPVMSENPDLADYGPSTDISNWSLQEVARGSAMAAQDLIPRSLSGDRPDGYDFYILYHATAGIPCVPGETRTPALHFEAINGEAWARVDCGGYTYEGYKPAQDIGVLVNAPLDVTLTHGHPGQVVDVWVKVKVYDTFAGLHGAVSWKFQ